MRVITVFADGNYQLIEADVPSEEFGEWCRSVVGGYFEVIRLPFSGVDVWIDEEGKYKDYKANEWATAAAFHGEAGLAPHDFIMGNVVCTGGIDREGNTIGLSDEQVAWLRERVVI